MKYITKIMLLTLLLVTISIFLHEFTHGQIYKLYGCENIAYHFNIVKASATANCPSADSVFAHSMVEIVGYNIVPFFIMIIMIIVIVNSKENEKKKRGKIK